MTSILRFSVFAPWTWSQKLQSCKTYKPIVPQLTLDILRRCKHLNTDVGSGHIQCSLSQGDAGIHVLKANSTRNLEQKRRTLASRSNVPVVKFGAPCLVVLFLYDTGEVTLGHRYRDTITRMHDGKGGGPTAPTNT